MSSFIGHSLIGVSIFANGRYESRRRLFITLAVALLLAVSPDVDYIILWLTGHELEPRYTHSLFFCLSASLTALLFLSVFFKDVLEKTPRALIFAAPLSHLILDLSVGVHPLPVFWPVSSSLFVLPHGILPSAGQLRLLNYYLWRNFLIETGILLPVALFISPLSRKKILASGKPALITVAVLFCLFTAWGYSLSR
jgi:hypothetical protein